MTLFPVVEQFRSQLRALDFVPLDDAKLERLQHRMAIARHAKALAAIPLVAAEEALFAMLAEERVPEPISGDFLRRFYSALQAV